MCATSELARKVLEAKGVAHYWDQVITFARDSSGDMAVNFKFEKSYTYNEQGECSVNCSNEEEAAPK
jgi:hypothetical protein